MSKELEALNEIKEKFCVTDGNCTIGDFGLYRRLDIIETALKRLEQAENCVFTSKEDVKKEHKALEIIKKRLGIELCFVDSQQTYYIVIGGLVSYPLKGEEEYNLLKEVLL